MGGWRNSPGLGEMEPFAKDAKGLGAETGVDGMSSPSSWKLGGLTGVKVRGVLSRRAFPGTLRVPNGLALDMEFWREERCCGNDWEKGDMLVGPPGAPAVGKEGCPWSCGRPVAREMSGKCVASAGALLVETRLEPPGTELESVLGTDALYVASEF